jgi:hypothetical protein
MQRGSVILQKDENMADLERDAQILQTKQEALGNDRWRIRVRLFSTNTKPTKLHPELVPSMYVIKRQSCPCTLTEHHAVKKYGRMEV